MALLAFDANGDTFFVFNGDLAEPAPQPEPRSGATKAKVPSVFTFPVRSKAHAATEPHSPPQQAADAGISAHDAEGAVAAAPSGGQHPSDCSQANDLVATISLRTGGKQGAGSKGTAFPYDTSLDTARPSVRERDQGSEEAAYHPLASTSTPVYGSATDPMLVQHRPSMQCQGSFMRGGGGRSSGGGAGLASTHSQGHHHAGWHNCEWWRSFSSSRLNQLAAEEPDLRSPEMRHVPYVGGAAAMCALVHGEKEVQ